MNITVEKVEKTDAEIQKLMKNYEQTFLFSKSIECGVSAFYLAVEHLEEVELVDVRAILGYIADQFSDEDIEVKKSRLNSLVEKIEKLSTSEKKKYIECIFRSLSEIPPESLEAYTLHHVRG
jgi:hypothetical protein